MNKKGREGEESAAQWLQENGYTILERNFRFRYGEVDIIAGRDGVLSFFEVKNWAVYPIQELERALNRKKQQRVKAAASRYLAENPGCKWGEMEFSILFHHEGKWDLIEKAFEG